MTVNLALEYIPRRMAELGFGSNYFIRFRHLILGIGEEISIEAFNHIYILIEDVEKIVITSDFGIYDLRNTQANEMLYEHQGQITITNQLDGRSHVKFIQIIPSNHKKDHEKH